MAMTFFNGQATTVHITGINFHTVPGTYSLPLGEGIVHVGDGRIKMNTKGGREWYEHPHTHYLRP